MYDPSSRTFVQKRREQTEPPSPDPPQFEQVYDPNTRSFVQKVTSSGTRSATASPTPSAPATVQPKKTRPAVPAVDTNLEPPPKNPARYSGGSPSPSSPPTSPRAAGMLMKQPSVVREDPEAEEQAEASTSPPSQPKDYRQNTKALTTPAKSYVTPAPHQRSASLDVPRNNADRGRNISVSPQRSAHFSPSPILKPEMHVPPPRDISPAKSALKHSPSSSVRGNSPMATLVTAGTGFVQGPSGETSEDGMSSVTSQDGLWPIKKKKSARVSFDEQPHVVQSPSTIALLPPVGESDDDRTMKPRPALPSFGSVRRNQVQAEPAEKVTEIPPARHETSSDHAIGGILRNISLSNNNSGNEPLPPEVTSKEPAGYISDESSEGEVPAVPATAAAELGDGHTTYTYAAEPESKDFATEAVTTTNDTAERLDNGDVPTFNLLPPTPGLDDEQKQLGEQEESANTSPRPRKSMEGFSVPGSFIDDDSDDEVSNTEPAASAPQPDSLGTRATAEDSAATQTVTPVHLPQPDDSQQQLSDIDEDSDDSAAFSDAVEDPDDLEDEGGFASLDAIVESPAARPSKAETTAKTNAAREAPESSSATQAEQKPGDWGDATAYWSQLSRERREQIEKAHLPPADDVKAVPVAVAAKKPKAVKKQPKTSQQPAQPAMKKSMRAQPGSTQPAPQTPTTMKKSMRAQPIPAPVPADEGVHMRRSMRDGPPPKRPQSEYIAPKGVLQDQTKRPSSSGGLPTSSAGAALRSSRPQTSTSALNQDSSFPTLQPKTTSQKQTRPEQPQVSARLQRELAKADDSDSESSFKKRRRGGSDATAASEGRYSMKRSMRSASVDQAPPMPDRRPSSPTVGGRGRGSFSLRSLSPQGSFFGRSKPTNTRDSLRDTSSDAGTGTTLRGPPVSRARSSMQSSRSAKPTPAPAPTSKSRFKSRFADSDDDDEDNKRGPAVYKSRFADSDDEDEPASPAVIPADLTPVRGIPRRQGQDDGDSTDLEDEDDDDDPRKASRKRDKMQVPIVPNPTDIEKAMAAARRNLGMTDGGPNGVKEGDALQKGSLRNNPVETQAKLEQETRPEDVSPAPEKKKRGFMGGILRRNRTSTSSIQQVGKGSPAQAPASPAIVPATPNLETPASPASPSAGKLVRRTSGQPKPTRTVSSDSTTLVADTGSPQTVRKTSDNWPLPPPIPEDSADEAPARPTTSDGFSSEAIKLARTMRPDIGSRTQSGQPSGHRVRIQAGEEGSEPGERDPRAIYSQRTGRKKKFGALRRAFGIND